MHTTEAAAYERHKNLKIAANEIGIPWQTLYVRLKKQQTLICDFVVCFCLSEDKEVERVLLVPSEFFKGLQTVSVSRRGISKWLDYAIDKDSLSSFFAELGHNA